MHGKINLKKAFLSTGGLVAAMVILLSINGWLDATEAKRKYRHCITFNSDRVFTDTEAGILSRQCAKSAGYTLPAFPR
jgi:hypothetical protein